MRITPSVLCFFLIFSAAPGADPVPASATDTYISARDRFIAAHKGKEGDDTQLVEARKGIERLLRAAVPVWTAPGIAPASTINLGVYDDPYTQGFSVLNGLVYGTGDFEVIVSNRALLQRWLADHNAARPKDLVPASVPAAFRSENFWTFALATDAAVHLRGMVLVKGVTGNDLATAEVGLFAQYEASDRDADTLFVAVVRGDRVFVAKQKLTVKLDRPEICKKALDQTLAKSAAALKAYQDSLKDQAPGKVKDASRFNEHLAYETKASREYRACFAQNLPAQKNYAAIQKQAQALVDLLH